MNKWFYGLVDENLHKPIDCETLFLNKNDFEVGWQACTEHKNVVIEQLKSNIDEYKRLTREIDSIISEEPAKQASLCDLVESIKQLNDKCKQQAKKLEALHEAAQDFVNKVDRGEAKSIRSYKKFKEALHTGEK